MLEITERLNQGLVGIFPLFNAQSGVSIGVPVVNVLVSFQPKDQWVNGILENSHYIKAAVSTNKSGSFDFDIYCQPRFSKMRAKKNMTQEAAVSYVLSQFKKSFSSHI